MLKSLLNHLHISDDVLHKLSDTMRHEMDRGLSAETTEKAEIKMLPTYVTGTPNGTGMIFFNHLMMEC